MRGGLAVQSLPAAMRRLRSVPMRSTSVCMITTSSYGPAMVVIALVKTVGGSGALPCPALSSAWAA